MSNVSSTVLDTADSVQVTDPNHVWPSLANRDLHGARGLRVAWFGHAEGRRADGLSTYSREVVTALCQRGVDVRFFSHEPDGSVVPVTDGVSLPAMRVHAMTLPHPGCADRIRRALAEFRPHVVHCSWSFSLLDGLVGRMARQLGAATVATFHLPYGLPASNRGRMLRGLYRYHVRNLLEYDTCIALSATQRDLLIRAGFPGPRICVVHNGVDTSAISPGPSGLKAELGAQLLVAYMGRLDTEKRVAALVESFLSLLWPQDHVLVIAGRGSQESRIRRAIARNSNVTMMGLLTDSQSRLDLLRAADIYVLPSTVEGLALGLLEAMAAGCAVVATEAGEDGRALAGAGICLPISPLEPHLSEALTSLRNDPGLRRHLAESGRQRVTAQYDIGVHVTRLLGVYRSLCQPYAATG